MEIFKRKYESAEELYKKIEEYFDTTPLNEQTRAGLCIFLGITKMTFHNYKNGSLGEEIAEAIEWACTRLENKYELDLGRGRNPAGPIFALKQYGWKNNHDVEVKGSGTIEIISNIPRPSDN